MTHTEGPSPGAESPNVEPVCRYGARHEQPAYVVVSFPQSKQLGELDPGAESVDVALACTLRKWWRYSSRTSSWLLALSLQPHRQ